ncbi:MAG: hypothetical protein ACXQTI_01800 [Candidatus Nezhaarchaeales archaeon]
MLFVRLKRFLHQAARAVERAVRLVICRKDLPENPRWLEQGYPDPNCWEIDEFFAAAARAGPGSSLYSEARRIFWEAYWRLLGRYRRGRPFFETYVIRDGEIERLTGRERWVLQNIIVAAMTHGIVPEEAKEYTYRVYREIYGPLVAR